MSRDDAGLLRRSVGLTEERKRARILDLSGATPSPSAVLVASVSMTSVT